MIIFIKIKFHGISNQKAYNHHSSLRPGFLGKSLFFLRTQGGLKSTKQAFLAWFEHFRLGFLSTISTYFWLFWLLATIWLFSDYFAIFATILAIIFHFLKIFYKFDAIWSFPRKNFCQKFNFLFKNFWNFR